MTTTGQDPHTSDCTGRGQLLALQRDVIEMIAGQTRLEDVLAALCGLVEKMVPGAVCSIMTVDKASGALVVESAPCVPPELVEELNGLVPSRFAGSCGTAVYRKEMVIVEDTLVDETWRDMRDLVHHYGIRACWSVPVFSRNREVLGTFAISRPEVGGPAAEQIEILNVASHLCGIALDWKQAESKLREQRVLLENIMSSTEDPIFVKDEDCRYVIANDAEARGVCQNPEDMVGMTDDDVYPTEIAERCREIDREILNTGESRLYEMEFPNAEAGNRAFLVRKSPLLDEEGRPQGVVGVARDITDLKRAEQAMLQTQKLESLGVLAGGIAHDFNNLLTGILGNASVALEMQAEDAPERKNLLAIEKAAVRASELTSQMLAYAGKGKFTKEVLQLSEVIEEVAELVSSSISKKANLEFAFAANLPAVEADPAQMRQLIMNLLTNASEALDGDAGTIRVELRGIERETDSPQSESQTSARPSLEAVASGRSGSYVELRISDTGMGMDAETLACIFDPFFTTKFTGRGLGLAAAQGIVRGHQGALQVESRTGEGTTFTVHLPAADRAVDRVERRSKPVQWQGDGKVLVVDDEESVRDLSDEVLRRANFEVLTASDGLEAVDVLKQNGGVQAIILDLTTPRLSGYEAFCRLREVEPEIPIVLASGYGEAAATSDFVNVDLAGFLQKPYLPAELVEIVRRALADRCTDS